MQHTQLSTPKPTVASEGLSKNGFNTTQSDERQADPGTTSFSGPASVPGFTFETSSSSKPPLQSFTEAVKMAEERMKQKIRDDNRFNKAFNITPMATGGKGRSGISAASGLGGEVSMAGCGQQTFLDELLRHDGHGDYLGDSRAPAEEVDKTIQLLRSSLFPATLTRPQTVFTFEMLDSFHKLTLEAKTTVYDYYHTIIRRTDALELSTIPSRCNDFHRAFRLWRVLLMLKRAGRGNDPTGVSGTQEGELTIECPACPHPTKNLPNNWEAGGALLFLYTLFLAVDANFKLKGKARKIKDVELVPGMGCFVEENAYQSHLIQYVDEGEINTCLSEHDAIVRAAVRCTPGYDVTGAGLVICSRHGLVRRNGAGDLQKGERYSNMDYIIFCTLAGVALARIVITYDIACQWSKNLPKRMEKLPEQIQVDLEKTRIAAAVPSWHINGHGSDCQTNYALAYLVGSGRTCGDEIESTWSQTNVLGASVREMASGGRHESLNDHFNGSNLRKMVGLRSLLPKKLREAAEMKEQHQTAFTKLSATFSDEVKTEWVNMVSQWESDPRKHPNPYEDSKMDTTLQDVRLQMAKEDAEEAARGAISAHQTSISSFLITGIELEEQQRTLNHQIKGNRLTTSKQKADLEDKRAGLARRINQWREAQLVYTPCVAGQLPSTRSDNAEGDQSVTPENLPLCLPSSLPSSLRATIPILIKKEKKLREAQCDDALGEIRCQRRILTGLVQFKKLNLAGQGNKPNTRVHSLYNRIQTKIAKADMRYQAARAALCILDPEGEWSSRLQVLKPGDIRGPGKDPEDVSNGRFIMSWIWLVPRARSEGPDELNGEDLDRSLRVEWVKARARVQRWEEEYLLVQEEMRRSVVYLGWKANWWNVHAALPAFKADDVAHGVSAYATKQAALCSQLATRFSQVWEPVLKDLGLNPQWQLKATTISAHQPAAVSGHSRSVMDDLGADLEEIASDDEFNLESVWDWDDESEMGGGNDDFELDDE
ncbi:hypothetical protein H1R20_g15975, partial [Candolleomyces eurysporus]